jgi:PilZ domain
MDEKDRRTGRRYYLQQPAFVRLQDGHGSEVEAITENVSTHGLLLRCKAPIALRSKVKVILRFPSCIPLEATGEVLRVEDSVAGGAFLVAVGCQTPLEILR